MLRKILITLMVVVVVVGVAGSAARWLILNKPTAPRRDAVENTLLVQVVEIQPETVRDEIVGYGSARADRAVVLTAEVAAPVKRLVKQAGGADGELVALEEGVEVALGGLLIELDVREFDLQFERVTQLAAADAAELAELDVQEENVEKLIAIAKGEEKVASDEVSRLSGLFEVNQASKREYDFARRTWYRADRDLQNLRNQLTTLGPRRARTRATRAMRLADIELAQLNIDRCRIRAPFAGRIDRLSVEQGQAVQRGTELLRIVAPDRVEIPIEVPVSSRPNVRVGAECTVVMESLPNVTWTGRIARLSPSADERSRTFRAYIEVDNRQQPEPLLPGYFVKAVLRGMPVENALLVPRVAVLDDNHVLVVNDAHVRVRRIEVTAIIKDRAVVQGELKPGDRVILTHLDKLTEGDEVEIDDGAASRPAETRP